MSDLLSHGLLASAGVAGASSAQCGSGIAAFTNDLTVAPRGRDSPRTPAPSRFTAAGRERAPSLEGSRNGVEMLLLEQNQLLMKQVALLQSEVQSSQARFEAMSVQEVAHKANCSSLTLNCSRESIQPCRKFFWTLRKKLNTCLKPGKRRRSCLRSTPS